MAVAELKMPQLGESVTEGTVDRWLKQEGDIVKRDEPLVEVVTDKVNAEIPSPFEGKLVKIEVAEGTTVSVGTLIARIEVEGDGPAPAPVPSSEAAPDAPAPAPEAPAGSAEPSAPAREPVGAEPRAGGSRRFSPAVRRLAEEHGIDPSTLPGTGEGGRVTRDDVLAYLERGGAPAPEAPAAEAPAAAAAPPAPA